MRFLVDNLPYIRERGELYYQLLQCSGNSNLEGATIIGGRLTQAADVSQPVAWYWEAASY